MSFGILDYSRAKTKQQVSTNRMKALLLLVGLLVLLVTGVTVFAVSGYTSFGGSVGTAVVAQKDVVTGGSSWNGKIYSYTRYRDRIGTIGWTYWTIREMCYSTIINQYIYSGYAEYNDDYVEDIAVDSISYCSTSPNGHEGRVLGNHEFKNEIDGQYFDWYKDWAHIENLFLQDY